MADPVPEETVAVAFARAAKKPTHWQLIARELVFAANLLYARYKDARPDEILRLRWPPPPIDLNRFHASGRPVLLLYGLAIENMVKAVLVSEGHPVVDGQRLSRAFKTHNLLALFRLAGINLDPAVAALLKRLHVFIESGKYPVGTRPAPDLDEAVSDTDVDLIHRVLDGLEEAVRALSESIVEALPKADLRRLGVSGAPMYMHAEPRPSRCNWKDG